MLLWESENLRFNFVSSRPCQVSPAETGPKRPTVYLAVTRFGSHGSRPGTARRGATAATLTGGNTQRFVFKRESGPRTDILHDFKPIYIFFFFLFFKSEHVKFAFLYYGSFKLLVSSSFPVKEIN